jgi:hypothetical protein
MDGQLIHARDVLRKYGEMILCQDGFYRATTFAYSSIRRNQLNKLVERGECRIDAVGESVFATAIEKDGSPWKKLRVAPQ